MMREKGRGKRRDTAGTEEERDGWGVEEEEGEDQWIELERETWRGLWAICANTVVWKVSWIKHLICMFAFGNVAIGIHVLANANFLSIARIHHLQRQEKEPSTRDWKFLLAGIHLPNCVISPENHDGSFRFDLLAFHFWFQCVESRKRDLKTKFYIKFCEGMSIQRCFIPGLWISVYFMSRDTGLFILSYIFKVIDIITPWKRELLSPSMPKSRFISCPI